MTLGIWLQWRAPSCASVLVSRPISALQSKVVAVICQVNRLACRVATPDKSECRKYAPSVVDVPGACKTATYQLPDTSADLPYVDLGPCAIPADTKHTGRRCSERQRS